MEYYVYSRTVYSFIPAKPTSYPLIQNQWLVKFQQLYHRSGPSNIGKNSIGNYSKITTVVLNMYSCLAPKTSGAELVFLKLSQRSVQSCGKSKLNYRRTSRRDLVCTVFLHLESSSLQNLHSFDFLSSAPVARVIARRGLTKSIKVQVEGFQLDFHDGQSAKLAGLGDIPKDQRVFEVPYEGNLCTAQQLFDYLREWLMETIQSEQWQKTLADNGDPFEKPFLKFHIENPDIFETQRLVFKRNQEALRRVFGSLGDKETKMMFLEKTVSDKFTAQMDIDEYCQRAAEYLEKQGLSINQAGLKEAMEIKLANSPNTVLVLFKIVN